MQSKLILIIGAVLAPFVAAAPAGDAEGKAVLKDRSRMDPLFEVMAWKEELDQILKNAMKEKSEDHGNKDNHNNGWSHPIWPYE
ncbi:hypothetical protein F4808DRAFT_191105 [Astrocystis sublimbata]|nr:hypothetical protein F4808DRAFT_191105 [Astrocystis sublimbata]